MTALCCCPAVILSSIQFRNKKEVEILPQMCVSEVSLQQPEDWSISEPSFQVKMDEREKSDESKGKMHTKRNGWGREGEEIIQFHKGCVKMEERKRGMGRWGGCYEDREKRVEEWKRRDYQTSRDEKKVLNALSFLDASRFAVSSQNLFLYVPANPFRLHHPCKPETSHLRQKHQGFWIRRVPFRNYKPDKEE